MAADDQDRQGAGEKPHTGSINLPLCPSFTSLILTCFFHLQHPASVLRRSCLFSLVLHVNCTLCSSAFLLDIVLQLAWQDNWRLKSFLYFRFGRKSTDLLFCCWQYNKMRLQPRTLCTRGKLSSNSFTRTGDTWWCHSDVIRAIETEVTEACFKNLRLEFWKMKPFGRQGRTNEGRHWIALGELLDTVFEA